MSKLDRPDGRAQRVVAAAADLAFCVTEEELVDAFERRDFAAADRLLDTLRSLGSLDDEAKLDGVVPSEHG